MSLPVSLCIIRIELSDEFVNIKGGTPPALSEAMASESRQRFSRGRRQMRNITIETYTNDLGEARPRGLIPGSESRESTPRCPTDEDCKSRRSCDSESETVFKHRSQIPFVSGNPFVEVTKGILHLYKENELTSMDRAAQRSQTICILAVPATMTCHDLLIFTAACHGDIQHLRIVRDGSPNQYMALLTFRTQQSAAEFYSSFNGAPFNSLEPECCCHLVFVSDVELVCEGSEDLAPPQAHTELPTCPVCLERMDESVDGILTILCNHSFHGSCLAKWGDTSCPVCRYVQTPEVVADNRCLECHSAESLWICLICGHVGCGRYVQGHAFQHYQQTQHCYAMQLGNNRVWDYVGDNFVHRLLQNKGDGKLVEGGAPAKDDREEKLDSVQLEFTYLLTSQLDSQRLYFEDKLAQIEQQAYMETAELKEKANRLSEENSLLQSKVNTLTREKQALDKKVLQLSNRLSSTMVELQDERQMSHALQQNQSDWQSKFSALEKEFVSHKTSRNKEIAELRDQLRDVMFFLEAQKRISESTDREEIAEGHIVIPETSQPSTTSKNHRRRRHR